MNKPKIIVIVPARKGSKGIKSKNKKLLLGKPLVSYTLEICNLLPKNYFPYVSTDDEEIIKIADDYKIKNNGIRPKNLSNDKALTLDVLNYELENVEKRLSIKFDGVLLLQLTCLNKRCKTYFRGRKNFVEKHTSLFGCKHKKIDSEHPFRMKRLIAGNRLINFIDQGFEDMRPRQELPCIHQEWLDLPHPLK